jgi:xylulokinase
MSLLGLDIGTTVCKGAAYSLEGEMLASGFREYPTLHPQPGWAELDSRQVWTAIQDVIADIARQTSRDPVSALSMSTMGEAMVPVSAERKILGNSIVYMDCRGAEFSDELEALIGLERFYEINPNIPGHQYSLPKLKWVQRYQPELYEQADKFLLWGDFTAFMLGAEPLISYSHANRTLLFDIRWEQWSAELLELTGIDSSLLSKPVASGTVAGTLDRKMAECLGLTPGIPLVVGGHDQCCNALGVGIDEAGKAVCGIGTIECITSSYDRLPDLSRMLQSGLSIEHHVLPGLYVSFLSNQAGSLIKWFRNTFASADLQLWGYERDIYEMLSAEMPSEPTSLLMLPYFEPTGTSNTISNASGAILGLKTCTTRGEILKSFMECETLYFLDGLLTLKELGIDTSEFVATGGGAKSDAWLQIKSDIFGVPFVRPKVVESGTLGAAMLAGIGTGAFTDVRDALNCFVKEEKRFEPDMRRHAIYQEKYQKYRQIYPLLKHLL